MLTIAATALLAANPHEELTKNFIHYILWSAAGNRAQ